MNQNKLIKKLSFLLLVFAFMASFAFAQNTVYVDVTNGSDTYSGANQTNNPAGTGPKATFAAARALVTDGGTIIIKAGTYAEAFDLSTGLIAATNSYTVKLSQLNANNDINFTAAGAATVNKAGLTVNIITEVGTEKINLTTTTFNLSAGNLNLSAAAAMVLANSTTINIANSSAFTGAAPTKTTNVALNYTGTGSFTAGPESNYGSYGTGTIVVGKAAGTTVTFPNAITAVAGISVTGGNATFSNAVAVSAGAVDVENSGVGTLTFNGTLSLGITSGATADANIASIVNTTTGSIVANGTVTWTVPTTLAAAAFADAAGTFGVDNQGAGSILLNGAITLSAPHNTTGADYSFAANNGSTGTLTLGVVSTPSSGSGNFEGTLRLIGAAAAGTINIAGGTYASTVIVNAAHTLNVNGATTIGGVFTNAGTTALTTNILTLPSNVAHVTTGGTVTASTGYILSTATGGSSFNGGTLGNLVVNGTGGTITLTGTPIFTNVTATAGTLTFGSAGTINGTLTLNGGNVTDGNFTITVNNYEQSSGTFTLAANAASILDVKGNFNRTGGTFAAGAASVVSFTGTVAQTVNGGPLFQTSALTFNNAAGNITVGNSIRASGNVTIATATNINFATTNLILNGTTNGITNNGTYTATGGGGVVIGGINTVTGGVAGAGAGVTYTLEGTGTYSYITIDVGAANLAEVVNTLTGVKWNGVLTLRSGTLDIATGGVDFSPIGTNASIVRYPEDAPGITQSLGTFNAANVQYDLTYTGAITGDKAVGSEISATPANVKTWTIQTTGAFLNTLPAGANLNFGGTLYIENGATLNLPTGAATQFILSGANKTHTVRGIISLADGGDAVSVTGNNTTINGSATVAHAATIGNFTTSASNLTIADVQSFAGTFATTGTATVNLGMGAAAADQVITGAVTLGGTSLTLTTNITSTAGFTQNAGSVVLNDKNLIMNAGYTQTAGTITSTGGYLQFNTAAGLSLVNAVPYLRANNVAITLGSAVTVSENLDIAGALPGTITNAGNSLTIPKTMTTVGGAIFTGVGNLILTGSTVTASGNPSISNLTINTDAIANLASTSTTARTFTVTDVLTQTKGELALGINHVSLTFNGAAFARAAGTITATTGQLIFAGTAAQSAAQGTGFSVPNLTINNTLAGAADVTFAGGATNDFTVTNTLRLTAGSFSSTAAGKLHLGNDATIIRNAALSSLVQIPTFDGDVNLSYVTGNGVMANEVPTAASAKLKNITINVPAALATAAATTFKGTATLTLGTWNNTGGAITIAPAATVVMNGGAFGQAPTATNYNLTYKVAGATTNFEFQSAKVDLLTIDPTAGNTVTLNAAKTVKDLTILSGTLANGGFDLTLTGNFNVSAGAYTGAGNMIIGGTTAQTITAPTTGLTLAGSLTINNAAGLTLAGGNLTMNATIFFIDGLFNTGDFRVRLNHTVTGQGFDRSGVLAGKKSHVVGNVAQAIPAGAGSPTVYANGRFEFPVGTATYYRPYAITFNNTNPAINPTTVVVKHVDSNPEGNVGLPIGNIGNYAHQYWLVKTTPSSFTSTQYFDVEMHGTNLGYPYLNEQNLRIIRRQDGASTSNTWYMQGTDASYGANYQVVTGVAPTADTLVVVRSTATLGGIVNEGTRFAIGMPSQAPLFTAPTTTTYTTNEGTAITVQFTADPRVINGTVVYSLVTPPAGVTISATGLVTVGTTVVPGTHTIVVKATAKVNGVEGLSSEKTITVTVKRLPVITGRITKANIYYGKAYTFNYTSNELTTKTFYFGTNKPATATLNGATGAFAWTPAKADSGKTFLVDVFLKTGTDSVMVQDTIMVTGNQAPKFSKATYMDTVYVGTSIHPSHKQSVSIALVATDVDAGADLVFTINEVGDIGNAVITKTGAKTATFTWTPSSTSPTGTYLMKIKVSDGQLIDNAEIRVRINNVTDIVDPVIPTEFKLENNYPNPFNPSTNIKYAVKAESQVRLVVVNVLGQVVSELVNDVQKAGSYEVKFNANNLSSGMYIYKLIAKPVDGSQGFVQTKKMMLVK